MLECLEVVVLFLMELQVQLVEEVVHILVVFLVSLYASECVGGGTIGNDASGRACGSGDA